MAANKVLVYFQREFHHIFKEGEDRQGNEYVVQQGYVGTQGVSPVAEADEEYRVIIRSDQNMALYAPFFKSSEMVGLLF